MMGASKRLAGSIEDPASFNNDSMLQLGLSDIVFFGFLEAAPPTGS